MTGSESDEDTTGSTKDPTLSQGSPSQDAPVDDSESSEAKAALTSSPAKNLTLDEGKARSQAAKAAPQKRADQAYSTLLRRGQKEGVITQPQEISNILDEQQECYQASQLQGASEVVSSASSTPVYPRGYYPPDAGSGSPMFLEHLKIPRGLNHGRTSRGAYERAFVQAKPLFVNDIEAARNLRVYPWVQPENTTTQSQAEGLFWRWVFLKNFTVQELKEIRDDRLLSYVLDQRDLCVEFARLIAKGLRQQSKASTHDERGYGSITPGTVNRKAAKKPRTTYTPAVVPDPRSQQPSGSQPGAGLPAPMSSVTRDNLATSQAAGASQSAAAPNDSLHIEVELSVPIKEGRRSSRT
ncbi:Hypothetical protein PHPALM_37230, partial [Phytophthora palmivora]